MGQLGYRAELDGIRGVAILLVVTSHAYTWFLPGGGMVGVTLFLALSGYLITRLLLEEQESRGHIDLRAFYMRRALRLGPALVPCLLVAAVLSGTWWPALIALAYSTNFARALGLATPLVNDTWSLSLEEQFYAVWPQFLRRARRPVVWASIGWILFVTPRAVPQVSGFLLFVLFRGDAILAGALMALISVRARRAWWAAWIPLAVVPFLGLEMRVSVTIVGLASAAAVVHAVDRRPRWLRWQPLVRIGKVSYGWYLWHYVWLAAIRQHPIPALINGILCTLVSWQFLEKPASRFRQKWIRRRPESGAVRYPAP